MASIGIILFIAFMFGVAWILNYLMFKIAEKLGWFTQPLRRDHWYDKHTARFSQWVYEKAEIYKIDF